MGDYHLCHVDIWPVPTCCSSGELGQRWLFYQPFAGLGPPSGLPGNSAAMRFPRVALLHGMDGGLHGCGLLMQRSLRRLVVQGVDE